MSGAPAASVPPTWDRIEVEPDRCLHCLVEGPEEAPFVLFDAGAFGIYADGWWLKENLKADFRVCLYDRAGMGRSDAMPDGIKPTPAFHVNDMRRLRQALGVSAPHIHIGHSMAGLRMAAYANLYPEDLAGLVFVDALSTTQFEGSGGRFLWAQFGWLLGGAVFGANKGLASPVARHFPNNFKLSGAPQKDKVWAYGSDRHLAATHEEVLAIDAEAPYFNAAGIPAKPVAIIAATAINGMRKATADLARARSGYGLYRHWPDEDHVSLLTGERAQEIADMVRSIHAHQGTIATSPEQS